MLESYLLPLLDAVYGRERSTSGSSPQSLSPLCLRQGLSLAWSTLCRLDYLASESWGFTCSTSVSSPPAGVKNA